MTTNLKIAGIYSRIGEYFYSNTAPFKIGLVKRPDPKPHQPPEYLMIFPHNADKLPNGKRNVYLSGLFKKAEGIYKIEWEGKYYRCEITQESASIDLWGTTYTTTSTISPDFG